MNMKKSRLLALFVATCGLFLAAADRKEIVVASGKTRDAAVNAFNARLDVRGKIDESVFLLGGSLHLEGEVSGDVICIAADVEIGGRAAIGRDLIVIGGRLRREGTSRVGGRVYEVRSREDLKQVAASVLPFISDSGGMTFFRIIKIFFWLVLSLMTLAVFPLQVAQASAMLFHQPLHHAARGLAALLIFLPLMAFFLLLSFVLIGIPLMIVLLAAYVLLLIFGRTVVFYSIGASSAGALRLSANPALFIVIGAAAYALFKFIPYVGWIIVLILDFFAVGIAAGYIMRRRKAAV